MLRPSGCCVEEGRDAAWCACSMAGTNARARTHQKRLYCYIFHPRWCAPADWVTGNEAPLSDLMPRMRAGRRRGRQPGRSARQPHHGNRPRRVAYLC